jgi:hypothetical protein
LKTIENYKNILKGAKMEIIKYKRNKYIKRNDTWFIIGENDPKVVTIGSLVKLQYQEIIDKLEVILKKVK